MVPGGTPGSYTAKASCLTRLTEFLPLQVLSLRGLHCPFCFFFQLPLEATGKHQELGL